jgi:hypothetical protein
MNEALCILKKTRLTLGENIVTLCNIAHLKNLTATYQRNSTTIMELKSLLSRLHEPVMGLSWPRLI